MNIFVSSSDPVESAKYLDDKRVIKMVLESAQLLSTAINECGGQGPYRTTHKNHPCAVWARTNKANYLWLYSHFVALLQEYTNRYNKVHKCAQVLQELADKGNRYLPEGELTQHPNCTTKKHMDNVYEAYREYLKEKWANDKRKPTWFRKEKVTTCL